MRSFLFNVAYWILSITYAVMAALYEREAAGRINAYGDRQHSQPS